MYLHMTDFSATFSNYDGIIVWKLQEDLGLTFNGRRDFTLRAARFGCFLGHPRCGYPASVRTGWASINAHHPSKENGPKAGTVFF